MFRAFLYELPQVVAGCYAGYRWLWHVLAAVLTAALVLSGFDWWFFEVTRLPWLTPFIFFAGIGGFFVPVLGSLGLYAAGDMLKWPQVLRAGIAMGHASLAGYFISTLYKVFTGRIQPEFLTNSGMDISHQFNFGFLQHGIFWGWPSSHAAVAVAGATALFLVWPNRAVRVAAVLWGLVVCVGAAIGFHWFSDVVAGGIIGVLAGRAAAQSDAT